MTRMVKASSPEALLKRSQFWCCCSKSVRVCFVGLRIGIIRVVLGIIYTYRSGLIMSGHERVGEG
jgi:hypothetical protein